MAQPLKAVLDVLYVLAFVFFGLFLKIASKRGKAEKITDSLFESVNIFTIWVILPSVAFVSIVSLETAEIEGFLAALLIGGLCSSVCLFLSISLSLLRGEGKEKTLATSLNSSFMNVTHLGLPAVYAILGSGYLAPAIAFALGVSLLHILVGTFLCNIVTGKEGLRTSIARVFSFPAVFAVVVAFLFLSFNVYVPEEAIDFFNLYLSPIFFAMMLIFTGYLLTIVRPKEHIRDICRVSLFRFLVGPAVTFFALLLMGYDFRAALTPKAALFLSAMPPGTFNLILAKNFGQNLKTYGILLFYTTLIFVLLVLPVFSWLVL